jgi:hypothetical protein
MAKRFTSFTDPICIEHQQLALCMDHSGIRKGRGKFREMDAAHDE